MCLQHAQRCDHERQDTSTPRPCIVLHHAHWLPRKRPDRSYLIRKTWVRLQVSSFDSYRPLKLGIGSLAQSSLGSVRCPNESRNFKQPQSSSLRTNYAHLSSDLQYSSSSQTLTNHEQPHLLNSSTTGRVAIRGLCRHCDRFPTA
jgi:hypothetical protein